MPALEEVLTGHKRFVSLAGEEEEWITKAQQLKDLYDEQQDASPTLPPNLRFTILYTLPLTEEMLARLDEGHDKVRFIKMTKIMRELFAKGIGSNPALLKENEKLLEERKEHRTWLAMKQQREGPLVVNIVEEVNSSLPTENDLAEDDEDDHDNGIAAGVASSHNVCPCADCMTAKPLLRLEY